MTGSLGLARRTRLKAHTHYEWFEGNDHVDRSSVPLVISVGKAETAMTTIPWIASLMNRELASYSRELDLFPDESLIWAAVPGIVNPAGNLALHVAGNLQFYIGATLGETGYVRDRDFEFSARGVSRETLQAELSTASRVVTAVLGDFPESRLEEIYPDVLGGVRLPTGLFLQHLGSHLAFHLGQVGYLRRVLTQSRESSGALSMKALQVEPKSGAPGS
jgi:hypothetical protein